MAQLGRAIAAEAGVLEVEIGWSGLPVPMERFRSNTRDLILHESRLHD